MTAKHWTTEHKRARREALAAQLASGQVPRCAIGGEPLPADTSQWDWAHKPGHNDVYLGWACQAHNRGADDAGPSGRRRGRSRSRQSETVIARSAGGMRRIRKATP